MGVTIPFALGLGAVLTGTAVGVHMVNKKKEVDAQKLETPEPLAEEKK